MANIGSNDVLLLDQRHYLAQCWLIIINKFCGIHQPVLNMYLNAEMLRYEPWWRHQMETFSALLAICAGNSPLNGEFPAQSQWRGALTFSLICALNKRLSKKNHDAGELRRHRAHYDVIVMTVLTVWVCVVVLWLCWLIFPWTNGLFRRQHLQMHFLELEVLYFDFEFYWTLFLRVQFTIRQHQSIHMIYLAIYVKFASLVPE